MAVDDQHRWDEAVDKRRQLEVSLRGARSRHEFQVHYQPIVRAVDGCISGAEALVRWRHPERSLASPAAFIPLAQETGPIHQLGERVLYTACREATSWPEGMRVAVNVSAAQFQNPGLVSTVVKALSSSGLPATPLELEITESVLVDDRSAVTETLHRLRALGVRTSLDDFGAGYSRLRYLRRFPFTQQTEHCRTHGDHRERDAPSFLRCQASALSEPTSGLIRICKVDLAHSPASTAWVENFGHPAVFSSN